MSDSDLATGRISLKISIESTYYYSVLSAKCGDEIRDEKDLMRLVCDLAQIRKKFKKFSSALMEVDRTGYGIVMPDIDELTLEEPEIVKQGGRYGVKLKAQAPSIHMIRANIETEIAPIVGSEKQAEDLVRYINETSASAEGIWNTNIFGKSIEELVTDGIRGKITKITDESQVKLQDSMQKIVNDSKGGMVCIII